jgi:mannose-6-phosphate isomerase-like protein (cupin superfamily)
MSSVTTVNRKAELIAGLPRYAPMEGHFHEVPIFLALDMFGGLPMEVAGGEISQLVGVPVAEPHVHSVPEIYLLLSPEKGGAEIEIEVEGERFVATSPAAFYVPAGARHRFLTRRAERGSYCLGVLLHHQSPAAHPGRS